MSSYLTGRFYLELQQKQQIEQGCRQLLEQIEKSIAAAYAERQRAREQLALRQAENSAAWVQGTEKARHLTQQREEYRERQILFRDQTAPDAEMEITRLFPEKEAAPRPVRKQGVVLLRASDTTLEESVWTEWLARIQALLEAEEPSVREIAERLLREAKNCAPLFRSKFLQEQEKRLQDLEKRWKDFGVSSQQWKQAQLRYEALCQVLQEQVDPEVMLDTARCEAQVRRMMRLWADRKGREYIAQTLVRVFANHGMTLQPDSIVQNEDVEKQFYQVAPNAVLAVEKRPGGAFEMEIRGLSRTGCPSTEERRSVAEHAVRFCRIYPEIQKELAQAGVLVADLFDQAPAEDQIVFFSNASAPEQAIAKVHAASLHTMESREK